MLRDIRNLALQHVREHWLRDLVMLFVFAVVVVTMYLSSIELGRNVYAGRLCMATEAVRERMSFLWIVAAISYSLFTLFGGYSDARRSYAGLLLPASPRAKFAWELIRTLVLFPLAALCLWYAFDWWYMGRVAAVWSGDRSVITSLRPITGYLTAADEPLNYIPVVLYAMVWFHSVAVVVRSGMNRMTAVAVAVAAVILPALSFMDSYPFVDTCYDARAAVLHDGIRSEVLWRSRVSWCSCMTGYALSYLWYAAMPVAFYALAYFKFKERNIK